MKKGKILKYALILCLLTVSGAAAFDKVGTTAAQFLQIGVGGRLPGMAGAGTALVQGTDALYWNPAGIVGERKMEFAAYYADWFVDLRHQFLGFTVPVGKSSAIGAFAVSLDGDDFEQTTLSFQEGNGVMVQYGDLALGAAYANKLTSRFSFGASIKYIRQEMFNESASTVAFDMGTHLDTDLPGFSIGMAMTNLGRAMTLEGRDLLTSGPEETAAEYQMSEWQLPLTFAMGIGWRVAGMTNAFRDGSMHGLTIAADGSHLNEGLTRWKAGVEYDFRQTVYLRTGKIFGHDSEDFSLGAGLRFPLGKHMFVFDFAYADMGDLGDVKRFAVGYR